jgi:hypothetical protein
MHGFTEPITYSPEKLSKMGALLKKKYGQSYLSDFFNLKNSTVKSFVNGKISSISLLDANYMCRKIGLNSVSTAFQIEEINQDYIESYINGCPFISEDYLRSAYSGMRVSSYIFKLIEETYGKDQMELLQALLQITPNYNECTDKVCTTFNNELFKALSYLGLNDQELLGGFASNIAAVDSDSLYVKSFKGIKKKEIYENFIEAVKTIEVSHDYKLISSNNDYAIIEKTFSEKMLDEMSGEFASEHTDWYSMGFAKTAYFHATGKWPTAEALSCIYTGDKTSLWKFKFN